jgi:Flp pilus assembly protein TadD
VQTAAGLAADRRGDLPKAEEYFRKARQINPGYAYALSGLAMLHYSVSKFRTGQALMVQAYHAYPDDPTLIAAWADTLEGAGYVAGLERALAIYDPASREARRLRTLT